MFKTSKLKNDLSRMIATAAKKTINDYINGWVQQEPSITDRLIVNIQNILEKRNSGVIWKAMTLTDRGANSQEKNYGADLLGIVKIKIDNFEIEKGFLAQAKRIEPNNNISQKEYDKLSLQCNKMLNLSPASFVFLYSKNNGIDVIPAIAIIGAKKCNPHQLEGKKINRFFVEHFECFIGDRSMLQKRNNILKNLCEENDARSGIIIEINEPVENKRDNL